MKHPIVQRHDRRPDAGDRGWDIRFAQNPEKGRSEPQDDLAFHASVATAAQNDYYLQAFDHINQDLIGFMRLSLILTRTGSKGACNG